jgi:two-component system, LuxR family, sensor kinase FixL
MGLRAIRTADGLPVSPRICNWSLRRLTPTRVEVTGLSIEMPNVNEMQNGGAAIWRFWPRDMPPILLSAVLLAVYIGLEWLSFMHEHNDLPVTPWNPGLGIMFAMIVLRGPMIGFVLLAGAFLAQVLVVRSAFSWPIQLAISIVVAVSYTAVASAAAYKLELGRKLLRTRDILILVTAGLVGAIAEATQLSLLLLATRQFSFGDISSAWLPLIVGDVIGIAVLAPLVLRCAVWMARPFVVTTKVMIELALLIIGVGLILPLVLSPPGLLGQSLFYLLFLPVVVAAVRHGIDGACAALAIVQLGLVAFLHWHGFDLSRFTEYQVMMLALTVTGLIVGGLVSERVAAREQLLELEAQATRTARLNLASGMAAALAHEINQPMTAARALARSVQELMVIPGADTGRMQRNLSSMIDQIDHAAAVVKRMREFLRRGEPHVSTLDMKVVLSEAAALMEPVIKPRKVRLRLDLPEILPAVYGDRVQIGQVVINLIKNSLDAIPLEVDGQIDVLVQSNKDGWVEVAVRDNGPGIQAEQAPRLFEPLNSTRPDGIGLGLSICKTIIQSHGGRIWLSSAAPGQTEFRFALPTAKGAPAPANPRSEGSDP